MAGSDNESIWIVSMYGRINHLPSHVVSSSVSIKSQQCKWKNISKPSPIKSIILDILYFFFLVQNLSQSR